jgi:hypothetical protein
MVQSVGRSFKDLQNKALGRHPLRYQFEVVPHAAGVGRAISNVSVPWPSPPPPPPPPPPQQPTHLCHLHAEDIPAGVTHCAVVWERGDKIQYVDPLEVDPGSSSVQFRHVMRQVRSSF